MWLLIMKIPMKRKLLHGGHKKKDKNSLPLKPKPELAFDESIVVELKFGRKKIFFTVLYRSPSQSDSELIFFSRTYFLAAPLAPILWHF